MNSAPPPSLTEFGLTANELEELQRLELTAGDNQAGISWMDKLLPKEKGFLNELVGIILVWVILWPFFLVGLLCTPLIQFVARRRLRSHPKHKNLLAYQDGVFRYERAKRDFWLRLTGNSFERQLADLYTSLGYSAAVTAGSGDQGVDIVLTRSGKRIIVQCKQHAKPIGPAIARELYGSLVATGADSAILACTSGFTPGVFDFVRDKPIGLVDVEAIVRMQEKVNADRRHPVV